MYLDLTSKQILILEFIKEQLLLKGYPPSVREICLAVDLKSTSTVHAHLNKLEKLGYIRRDATKPRAIEILGLDKPNFYDNQEIINLPVVGEISAGVPIFADENIEEYIPMPMNLIKGKNNFIMKVKGDSMINAGIFNGDYIIVDKQNFAQNSKIVVALIDGESATVKRFFREKNDLIMLQPENETLEPLYVNVDSVEIIGIVTGVFRIIK
jgi:repressor LexA